MSLSKFHLVMICFREYSNTQMHLLSNEIINCVLHYITDELDERVMNLTQTRSSRHEQASF